MSAVEPDDLALLVYTSGTTGVPKGAKCTHRGIDAMGQAFTDIFPQMLEIDPSRYVSYLPLCHAAEQAGTNFTGLRAASETYFCSDLTKIKDYLVAARPHFFFAVPRVWEKLEAVLRAKLSAATGLKAKLATWARRIEFESAKRSMETGKVVDTFQRRLANTLVISKIKRAIGFDEIIVVASSAAPAALSTLEFFASIGILIHEAYGMTEATGLATAQPLGVPRFGSVGQAIPGVKVRIADDGEIQLRGPTMVSGYLYMPDESAALNTDDGWENHLQGILGVGQAVVVGDRQPYLCAILALEEETLPDLCKAAGVPVAPLAEIASNEKVRAFLANCVESDCNSKVARFQTIKKFEVLPHMLSVEGGELTPTLKVKRNIINVKYKAIIDNMYVGLTP
ncbi:MAG: AMP-binding protein [Acidobacteria bacterium]|nr:AMP-binding protein [Candidatus Sulfomarinibacter kjeldsenii]